MDVIAESDVAVEVLGGAAVFAGEITMAPFLEMRLDAGRPVALSSDAHTPEQLGHEYERAVEWLGEPRRDRDRRLRRAAAGGDRMTRTGVGFDSHCLEAGRRLILGGVEIEGAEAGLAGHSDADVLTHAVIDALLGAAGHGRHRPALPRHRRALAGRRLDRAAGAQSATCCATPVTHSREHRRDACPRSAQAVAIPRRDEVAAGGRGGTRRRRR